MTFEEEMAEIQSLTPEQLTLRLARQGVMPEDIQRSLDKALLTIRRLEEMQELPKDEPNE